MVAASIALTWIVLTAASMMGLSALARAAAGSDTELDLASFTLEDEQRARRTYVFDPHQGTLADTRQMAWGKRR